MSPPETPAVGSPIRSHCTKCRKPSRHIVVSVVGEKAAKVQCTLCDGVHNYRDPVAQGKRSSRGASPARRKGAPAPTLHEEWQRQIKGRDPDQAFTYGQPGHPGKNDLVSHPSFGFGVVLKAVPPNKVEVLFEDGARLLRWSS